MFYISITSFLVKPKSGHCIMDLPHINTQCYMLLSLWVKIISYHNAIKMVLNTCVECDAVETAYLILYSTPSVPNCRSF